MLINFTSKRNLQDQLVLFGSALPFFFMLPFSIFRLVKGDYALALVDFMICVGLAVIFYQAWRGTKKKHLNVFFVLCFMIGVSWVMYSKGIDLIYWAFPAFGFTYFVLKSREALLANAIFLGVITFIFFDVLTKIQVLNIYPSLILTCLFGYFFSVCTEMQNQILLNRVSIDTLTGVKNRRSFDEKIEEILDSHRRFPKPVSMLLLDLDYFKKINDSYGHKQGDQVLTDFAQAVKSIVRTSDYVFRFGGEEFVVIANNSSLESAGVLAESIREFVLQCPSLSKYNVTVSIGVSEIVSNDNADSWFRRADRALYESKDTGRNKVTLAALNETDLERTAKVDIDRKVKLIPAEKHCYVRPVEIDSTISTPAN